MYSIQQSVEVTPDKLSSFQMLVLNGILEGVGEKPYSIGAAPTTLAFACLRCGTTAHAPDQRSRDLHVENFDMTCCGLTVVFHTRQTSSRRLDHVSLN